MVTGSSTGIGRAIALALASQGARLVIHGRRQSEQLRQTAELLERAGHSPAMVTADFASDELDAFIDAAWKQAGPIDVWVNNAGGDVLTTDWAECSLDEQLDYLWRVDVRATLLLSRAIGERMRAHIRRQPDSEDAPPEGSRCIINMGWDQALQGMAGDSGQLFATTKGAVMAMTGSLAQSLAPEVRVNAVAPGWIQTQWGLQASDYWDSRARQESLMQRWGTPEDVAHAVAWLASPAAHFVAGHVLPVNGGFRYGQGTTQTP